MRNSLGSLYLPLAALVFLGGCGYYSFTGASIPAHLGSVAIPLTEDRAAAAVPNLDQRLTEFLIERFAGRTRLQLETNEDAADAVLLTIFSGYRVTPVAVTGQQIASLNRVTLEVSVRYVDQVEDVDRLERRFTSHADYDPAAGGLDAEAIAALAALEQIADDIFAAATADW